MSFIVLFLLYIDLPQNMLNLQVLKKKKTKTKTKTKKKKRVPFYVPLIQFFFDWAVRK